MFSEKVKKFWQVSSSAMSTPAISSFSPPSTPKSGSKIVNAICCVADAQGFCVKGEFIICELSFYNGTTELHQSFKPDINWPSLSSKEYKNLQYTRDHVHGLELHPRKELPLSSEARSYILEFFRSTREFARFIGVKNSQLEKEFKLLRIPYKRLEDAPKLATLDEKEPYFTPWVCSSHKKISAPTPRCTVRKCIRLWDWLKDNEKQGLYKLVWDFTESPSRDEESGENVYCEIVSK